MVNRQYAVLLYLTSGMATVGGKCDTEFRPTHPTNICNRNCICASPRCSEHHGVQRLCDATVWTIPGERSNDNFGETSNVGLNSSLKGSLKNTGDNSLFSWRYLASCPDDADGALRWSFLVRHCCAYQLHAARTEVFVAGRDPFGIPCRLQNNSQVWLRFEAITSLTFRSSSILF